MSSPQFNDNVSGGCRNTIFFITICAASDSGGMEFTMAKTMKLKSIKISGYKSYGNNTKTMIDFKDINVIIGANGAGKSNLISFFDMLSFMTTGAFQRYVGIQGQAQSLLYFGAKETDTSFVKLFDGSKQKQIRDAILQIRDNAVKIVG